MPHQSYNPDSRRTSTAIRTSQFLMKSLRLGVSFSSSSSLPHSIQWYNCWAFVEVSTRSRGLTRVGRRSEKVETVAVLLVFNNSKWGLTNILSVNTNELATSYGRVSPSKLMFTNHWNGLGLDPPFCISSSFSSRYSRSSTSLKSSLMARRLLDSALSRFRSMLAYSLYRFWVRKKVPWVGSLFSLGRRRSRYENQFRISWGGCWIVRFPPPSRPLTSPWLRSTGCWRWSRSHSCSWSTSFLASSK